MLFRSAKALEEAAKKAETERLEAERAKRIDAQRTTQMAEANKVINLINETEELDDGSIVHKITVITNSEKFIYTKKTDKKGKSTKCHKNDRPVTLQTFNLETKRYIRQYQSTGR